MCQKGEMKVFNAFLTESDNIGESTVSPLDYFDFPYETEKINIAGIENDPSDFDGNVFIYGGGGLIHLPNPNYNNGKMDYLKFFDKMKCIKIAWGVGINIHGAEDWELPDEIKRFDLRGIRDDHIERHVPCASCMSGLFAKDYVEVNEFGIYSHAAGIDLDMNCPKFSALNTTFEKAISFIGSCHNIITNSYHAAYWSLLLNKKVIVYKPFSSKFFHLHENILFVDHEKEIYRILNTARVDTRFKFFCRTKNEIFFQDVLSYIKGEDK